MQQTPSLHLTARSHRSGLYCPAGVLLSLLLGSPLSASAAETPESWYANGEQTLASALRQPINKKTASNVILFVGDGMGISTITAARIYDGQSRGEPGEENFLSFEQFPAVALAKTYNSNQQTPDSAGTMTAMMSGIKTKAGFIGVNQLAKRADCTSSLTNSVPTLLEQAELAGYATGIVSTARITHATPAATFAHVPERDWEDDADLPEDALKQGCRDIASQLIDFAGGDGIEVVLGGGLRSFIPANEQDPLNHKKGERKDQRNLAQEWLAKHTNSAFIWQKDQLRELDIAKTDHLLGLFNRSHMSYRIDRDDDASTEPTLEDMTATAIKVLQKNRKGFFLMVEAGRIDHGHHAGNAKRALTEAQELSRAVQVALDATDSDDTLIIVTADHSHTFTMAGYPTRGNPILGKVIGNDDSGEAEKTPALAEDKLPYTTLGYRNGQGFATDAGGDSRYRQAISTGRKDLTKVDTEDEGFHQESLVPLESETHGGEDVAIYASGPWAHLFHSTHEQHYIYHVMRHAFGKGLKNKDNNN